MEQAYGAVTKLLNDYFDGLYHSDSELLAQVFDPRAQYICAVPGASVGAKAAQDGLLQLGRADYLPVVAERPSPASRGEPRRDRILSIEFAGPETAFARVECAIGTRAFTDFLSLVRVSGQWRIIAKVFHYDETAAA